MRRTLAPLLLIAGVILGCDEDRSSAGASRTAARPPTTAPAAAAAPVLPPGDAAALPKVAGDSASIANMLRERFGEAVARNVRVTVEDQGGGKRVIMVGEVPSEEFRQAIMNEVSTRVENIRAEEFNLEVAGPIRLLFGFDARVSNTNFAAFTPDLRVTALLNGNLYETATGRRINRIPVGDGAESMSISDDGKSLAIGFRDGRITLWELPAGRLVGAISEKSTDPGSRDSRLALAFLPGGKQVVSVSRRVGAIHVWDVATGASRQIGTHEPLSSAQDRASQYRLCVAPDGKLVATMSDADNFVTVWDLAARARKATLQDPPVNIAGLAWSHDGKSLAAARCVGDRRGVVVWNVADGQHKILALDHDPLIESIAFSRDDRTLAVNYRDDGTTLWDLATAQPWITIEGTKVSSGRALAFSPDGTVLASQCDTTTPPGIKLWDVSRRPGGGGSAELPGTLADLATADDRLVVEVERRIRGNFDRRNFESLKVEFLPDGSIRLSGKVSSQSVKDVAGREAETYRPPEEIGETRRRRVQNDLEVTGRYGE